MKKPNDDPNTEDSAQPKTKEECSRALHILDSAPAPGWTAHVTKDGRLYYCKYVCKLATAISYDTKEKCSRVISSIVTCLCIKKIIAIKNFSVVEWSEL